MTSYPKSNHSGASARHWMQPFYSTKSKHPDWTVTDLRDTEKLKKQAIALSEDIITRQDLGTMNGPLRMWNTAGSSVVLGNTRMFLVAQPEYYAGQPVTPFGQVTLDQNAHRPLGAQTTYGFC